MASVRPRGPFSSPVLFTPGGRWLRLTVAVAAGSLAGSLLVDLSTASAAPVAEQAGAVAPAAAPARAPVAERPDPVSARLTAKLQGSPVEIAEARTERSSTFANADGSRTVQVSAAPTRVRQGDQLVPVDLLLQERSGRLAPAAGPVDVSFSTGGSGPAARIVKGARSVGLGWEAPLASPRVSGATASYGLGGGASLEVAPIGGGMRAHVLLARRPASAPVYRVPLTTTGLDVTERADGSLEFTDPAGSAVFEVFPPLMWDARTDAAGDPAVVEPVASRLLSTPSGPVWELAPSAAFLADPGTVYPVTVDPTVVEVGRDTDTYVKSNVSTTRGGEPYLWAGLFDDGSTARTLLKFDNPGQYLPAGAVLQSAQLTMYNYYTETCTAKQADVKRITQNWTSSVTWPDRPGTTENNMASKTFAHGFNSNCPGDFEAITVTGIVNDWLGGADKHGFKIVANNETAVNAQKRFCSINEDPTHYACDRASRNPVLTLTYNRRPGTATSLSAAPTVIGTNGPRYSTSLTPTLTAAVPDADGDDVRVDFEVWTDPSGASAVWSGSKSNVQQGATTSITVPSGTLTSGADYQWRARGHDGSLFSQNWSAWQKFRTNIGAPVAPTVLCPAYPQNAWTAKAASPVTCTLDTTSTDGSGYYWELDDPTPDNLAADTGDGTGGDPQNITINPIEGAHTLHARTRDVAHNLSTATTAYQFGVGVGNVLSPAHEDRTQEAVTLSSDAPDGETKVTYKYLNRIDESASPATYTTVPVADVTGLAGGEWPQTRADNSPFANLTWNVWDTVGQDGPIQLIACFNRASGGADVCSEPVTFTVERAAFGASYATAPIGPGQVSLQTGDFAVDAGDAAVGDLAIGRTHTTLAPPGSASNPTTPAEAVLGPGWSAALPAPAGRAVYQLADHSANGYVLLTGPAGEVLTYTVDPDNANRFTGLGDAFDGSVLTKEPGTPTKFHLIDNDGTQTIWTSTAAGWAVTSVDEPGDEAGAEDPTSYDHDTQGRVTRMLAPVPAGVNCPLSGALEPGCRALELTYATTTTATGTGSGQWGDYTGQLKEVSYTAYNPATSAMATTPLASFSYDNTGHLRAAWDARISPALKTTYGYDAAGRLTSLSPPGLASWTLAYANDGRLAHVSRQDPAHGTATQAVAYDAPVSGAFAPIDLSANAAATWGQENNLPREGAGLFPASHAPPRDAGSGAYTPAAGDWQYADLNYLDVNGRPVNTAAYGAGAWQVATTEYDQHGALVRELSAGNRAQALNPTSDTDPHVAAQASSADRADLLATASTYNAAGDLSSETGPTHQVQLASGAVASARTRTSYDYDQTHGLLTATVVEPVTVDGTATSAADTRTTRTGYDPILPTDPSGWDLGQPTTETVVMSPPPDNVRRTRYDSAGRIIETRMPKSNGNDAGTTTTTYYSKATNPTYPACGNKPEWAGAVCRTGPSAQPAGQPIPVTTTSYDLWGNPTSVTEASGPTTRVSTIDYDAAGRPQTQSLTVTPAGDGGTPVPDKTIGHSPTTGLPTTQTAGGVTITTDYDNLGRPTTYTDADNNTTTTTYTIDSQPATINDGKGTYTYNYNGTDAAGRTERRGLPTSLDTGMGGAPDVFTAAYGPDGQRIRHDYPNGLVATTSHDNNGQPTRLTYAKAGTDWYTFTQSYSPQGDAVAVASPGSQQAFLYDELGRLEKVDDTISGGCTTRLFSFDQNSNRDTFDSYPPAADGTCTTTTTPVHQDHDYDTADRATDPGYIYDRLGRTTTVPSAAVAGGADLTVGYYANDMVASETQNGSTLTYALDPANRARTITSPSAALRYHYGNTGDRPTWIGNGTGWTRNVAGLDGGLAALQFSDGTTQATELELTNLHGDIIATSQNDIAATGPTAYFEHTEYGQPRSGDPTAGTRRYEWLGGYQRSSDAVGGTLLMGRRIYNPASGRFLQVDPVVDGSANAYDYAAQNPVMNVDLSGEFWKRNRYATVYRIRRAWAFDDYNVYLSRYGTVYLARKGPIVAGAVCGVLGKHPVLIGVCVGAVFAISWIFDDLIHRPRTCVKFQITIVRFHGPPRLFRCAR